MKRRHSLITAAVMAALLFAPALSPDAALCSAKKKKCIYTNTYTDKKLTEKARQWIDSGAWRNGFTKASPHESVNVTDMYLCYHKSPETWNAMFAWLQQTDLLNIKAGKHRIPGTNLIASVEDSKNEELSKRKSESHRFNIDFMLVVKGTEGFRRLDHNSSTPSTTYKYDVVRYNYKPELCEKIEVGENQFIVMFPDDWHIAKVKTESNNQSIRVIVVKIPFLRQNDTALQTMQK